MSVKLGHLIKFVADMDTAVAYYRDALGMKLRFASPHWSEFETGETSLALHPASDEHPAGTSMAGYQTDDLKALYDNRSRLGLTFVSEPADLHGALMAYFLDIDGAKCTMEQARNH